MDNTIYTDTMNSAELTPEPTPPVRIPDEIRPEAEEWLRADAGKLGRVFREEEYDTGYQHTIRHMLGDEPCEKSSNAHWARVRLRKMRIGASDELAQYIDDKIAELDPLANQFSSAAAVGKRMANAYKTTAEFEHLSIPGVYAYSLPWIIKNPNEDGNILIKVGRGERVLDRFVAQACATEAPEKMVLLAVWATEQPMETERTFHNLLVKAGHRRSTGGREWFVTNLDYLQAIGEALTLKTAFLNEEIEEIG